MPFRLYSNENFPRQAVEHLRRDGHDVLTVADSGYAGQAWADAEVLRLAVSQQRAVVPMHRRHFILLHKSSPERHGIIVCTYDPDFSELTLRIHRELERLVRWKAGWFASIGHPHDTRYTSRATRSQSYHSIICGDRLYGTPQARR